MKKMKKFFFRSNVIACKLQVLKKNDSLCNNKTGYVLISNKNNIDIDSEDDFNFTVSLSNDTDTDVTLDIDVAVEAEVDAIKFQTFKAEQLVSKIAPKGKYQKNEVNEQSQLELIKPLELEEKAHYELIDYCNARNIRRIIF